MPPTAAVPAATPAGPPMQPITVTMFRAMVRAGIIGEEDPVYLWKGRLARRMTPNRPHSIAVDRCRRGLESTLPPGFHVQQEQPVAMRTEHSTPEPDLAILQGRPEDYPDDFPTTQDLILVVEVADTSIGLDRDQADDLAREGVPTCWIVDLEGSRIEVLDDPADGTYRRRTMATEADDVPVVIEGHEVGRLRVVDLLPPPPSART